MKFNTALTLAMLLVGSLTEILIKYSHIKYRAVRAINIMILNIPVLIRLRFMNFLNLINMYS